MNEFFLKITSLYFFWTALSFPAVTRKWYMIITVFFNWRFESAKTFILVYTVNRMYNEIKKLGVLAKCKKTVPQYQLWFPVLVMEKVEPFKYYMTGNPLLILISNWWRKKNIFNMTRFDFKIRSDLFSMGMPIMTYYS